jgi:hypothetical protein
MLYIYYLRKKHEGISVQLLKPIIGQNYDDAKFDAVSLLE